MIQATQVNLPNTIALYATIAETEQFRELAVRRETFQPQLLLDLLECAIEGLTLAEFKQVWGPGNKKERAGYATKTTFIKSHRLSASLREKLVSVCRLTHRLSFPSWTHLIRTLVRIGITRLEQREAEQFIAATPATPLQETLPPSFTQSALEAIDSLESYQGLGPKLEGSTSDTESLLRGQIGDLEQQLDLLRQMLRQKNRRIVELEGEIGLSQLEELDAIRLQAQSCFLERHAAD